MDLPFTNIRQVLSLHNKVSPEKIFLTVISDQGREELSYGEFSARCHQTANFLQEDLRVEPGDLVIIFFDDQLAVDMVLIMACWLVGAAVALGWDQKDEESGRIKACFFSQQHKSNANFSDTVPTVQIGGTTTEEYLHFNTLVRSMPNSFFNDKPEPRLDTPVLQWVSRFTHIKVTQGDLLISAKRLADSQVITGNQRLINGLPMTYTVASDITLASLPIFMTALLVGSSLIISAIFEPAAFWHEVAASRLHVACLGYIHLQQLIIFANEQKALGKPIYGEGVYQQDIKQLRHIYCPDAKGQDDLIREFTALFPFPIVTGD